MSQPFDRTALIPAPREVDERLKDWWVESPWEIPTQGKSLSGFERNRVFLNSGGRTFFEISALTGADSDGDGRSVVAIDFNHDGMEDLIVRQAGGGAVALYENRFPKANSLRVSLRGTRSNRFGIGARLVATIGGQRVVRELFPPNGFKAQGSSSVHIGLGSAASVDRLTIQWPSGLDQTLTEVEGGRHVRVTEGSDTIEAFPKSAEQ